MVAVEIKKDSDGIDDSGSSTSGHSGSKMIVVTAAVPVVVLPLFLVVFVVGKRIR